MFFQPILLNDETFDIRIARMGNFSLHWHSDLEIIYCLEGTFNIYVAEKKYNVMKNDIVLVGSCEPHQISDCAADSTVVIIRLGSLFCGSENFKKMIHHRFEIPILKNDPDVISEIGRIVDLQLHKKTYKSDIALRGRLYSLLSILLEKLPTTSQISENHQKRRAIAMRIQRALDLVATRYNEEISLDEAADVSGYVKSAFCRIFKNATGSTFHKYLNDYRVKKALMLLDDNHHSIAEISTMVGFSQQKNFSRIFKSAMGISPSKYREKSREDAKNEMM